MVRLAVLSLGTRGDVQPYVALCHGLAAAGHDPVLCAPEAYGSLARAYGVEMVPVVGDISAFLDGSIAAKGRNMVGVVRGFVDASRPLVRRMTNAFLRATRGAEAVVVGSTTFIAGHVVVEKRGVPLIRAQTVPGPSRSFPSPVFPIQRHLGGPLNLLTHAAMEQLAWQLSRRMVAHGRRALRLPGPPLLGPERAYRQRRQPLLCSLSRTIVPEAVEQRSHEHVTGYWYLPGLPPGWRPPADLERFLAAGPPPVYVGFGSMSVAGQVRRMVLSALRWSGQRAVVDAGLVEPDEPLPDGVAVVRDVPHDWLFPHLAAVVWQGGVSTLHAGLRAGVPLVPVPTYADGFFWARRARHIGVATRPVPVRRMTGDKLVRALDEATRDPQLRGRAQEIAARVRQEDGVGAAVALVERYVTDPTSLSAAR